jgi:hypothetical protein
MAGDENTVIGVEAAMSGDIQRGVALGFRAGKSGMIGYELYIANEDDKNNKENTWIYGDSIYNVEIPNGNLILPQGAVDNYVLTSDATGTATWKNVTSSGGVVGDGNEPQLAYWIDADKIAGTDKMLFGDTILFSNPVEFDSSLAIPLGHDEYFYIRKDVDSIHIHSDYPVSWEIPGTRSMTEDDWTMKDAINGEWDFNNDVRIERLAVEKDIFVNGYYQGTPESIMDTISRLVSVDTLLMIGDVTDQYIDLDTAIFSQYQYDGDEDLTVIKRMMNSVEYLVGEDTTRIVLKNGLPDLTWKYILPEEYNTIRLSSQVITHLKPLEDKENNTIRLSSHVITHLKP